GIKATSLVEGSAPVAEDEKRTTTTSSRSSSLRPPAARPVVAPQLPTQRTTGRPLFSPSTDRGRILRGRVQMIKNRLPNTSKRHRIFFHLRDALERLPRKNDEVEFELDFDDFDDPGGREVDNKGAQGKIFSEDPRPASVPR
ncbi:unnamed protein product, partial [Amoebophrya sp. A120]